MPAPAVDASQAALSVKQGPAHASYAPEARPSGQTGRPVVSHAEEAFLQEILG